MRRGVLYLRQSTEKEETISDAIQRTAGTDYAARNGIELVSITDPEFPSLVDGELWEQQSGRAWYKRKGVQRAMSLVESGHVDVIVLWKWSRLSRRKLHWALAEDAVEKLGGTIESATEQVDLTTSAGRFSRNVLIDLAEMQSDSIGEGWRDAHSNRRRRGLPAVGGRKYGYRQIRDSDGERYEIDPDEAKVIEWVVGEYLDGKGWPAIVTALNRSGTLNSRGSVWRPSTLKETMDSGFAAGLLARWRAVDSTTKYTPLGQRAWDEGAHEPIIDANTWRRYLAARNMRATVPTWTTRPAHPLAGLIRCGDCGYRMTRRPHPKGAQFFCQQWAATKTVRCVNVRESRVLKAVMEWLSTVAEDVDAEAMTADVQRTRLRDKTDVEMVARQIVALDKQLTNLTKQLVSGVVPEPVYVKTRDELTAERAELEQRLAAAEGAHRSTAPVSVAVGVLRDWDILPVDRKRDLLRELIDRIEVYPSEQRYRPGGIAVIPTW